MDFIMNILGTFYSGFWLFASIPTSMFIFVMLCIQLNRALVRKKLKKWSTKNSLLEFGDGKEYHVKTSIFENLSCEERKRQDDLDEFMEDNNGIKSPKERRDDAINTILGKDL